MGKPVQSPIHIFPIGRNQKSKLISNTSIYEKKNHPSHDQIKLLRDVDLNNISRLLEEIIRLVFFCHSSRPKRKHAFYLFLF